MEERSRIARELHDTLLQGFTGITLELEALRGRVVAESRASAEDLGRILDVADGTLREAREMVWDLRAPDAAGPSLIDTLDDAARPLLEQGGLGLTCRTQGVPRRLPPTVASTVLRVSKEAVTNVVQHANAKQVTIELGYEPGLVRLTIADDGVGTDPARLASAPASGHWGIAGMRERATRAGGTLEVNSAVSMGMTIVLTVPTEPGGER
jgi:signal transduction histidine kinase